MNIPVAESVLVSAIVPTRFPRRLPKLKRAVESILTQGYPHVEVLVVADGPEAVHVEELSRLVPDSRLRIVRRDASGGPGAARNTGAREASGRYLALLDDDDVWLPGKLEAQIELAGRHPDAALVFTDSYIESEGGTTTLFKKIDFNGVPSLEQMCRENFIPTLSVLILKSAFEEAGGFDPAPELVGLDDYDLWPRVLVRHRAVFCAQPLAVHYRHEENYSQTPSFFRAELYRLEKHERLLAAFPECLRYVRRRMSKPCRFIAYEHLLAGRMPEARTFAARAIKADPQHWKNYAYWLVSFTAPGVYRAMRRMKFFLMRRGSA
jgi:glycosyltransferase involved in cell wall biosynthesis